MAKDVLITPLSGQIEFSSSAGAGTGIIKADGDNLVISNVLGDVLLGDGASDVFIGDGTNNVDIVFEQSGEIRADVGTSGKSITLGSNITDIFITGSDTIVIQKDGGNVGIGTTSADKTLDVVGDIRATGDIIAQRYVVSSSVTHLTQSFSSGSTIFGDTPIDDTHQFTGSVSISGSGNDLIVGGTIKADNIIVSSLTKGIAFSNAGVATDQYIHGFGNQITIDGDNYVEILADNEVKINAPKLGIGTIYSSDNTAQVPEALTVTGNISASGNVIANEITTSGAISASGGIVLGSGTFAATGDTKTDAAIVIPEDKAIYTVDGGQYLRNLIRKDSDIIKIGQGGTSLIDEIRFLPGSAASGNGFTTFYSDSTEVARIDAEGNITASGEISSSDIVYGTRFFSGNKSAIRYVSNTDTMTFNTEIVKAEINALNLKLDAPVTASGDISGSATSTLTIGGALNAGNASFTNVQMADLESVTNITASGQISASGKIIGDEFHVNDIDGLGMSSTNHGTLFSASTTKKITIGKSLSHMSQGTIIHGHITASGNISSSGELSIPSIVEVASIKNFGTGDDITIASTDSISIGQQTSVAHPLDITVQFGADNSARFTGHITASGNISSSGDITASNFVTNIPGAGNITLGDIGGIAGVKSSDDLFLEAVDDIFIKGGASQNTLIDIEGDEQIVNIIGNFKVVKANSSPFEFHVQTDDGGNVEITTGSLNLIGHTGGHITASGNISSSGDILTSENITALGTITAEQLTTTDDLTVGDRMVITGDILGGEDSQIALGENTVSSTFTKVQISHHQNGQTPVSIDFLKSRGTEASPTVVNQGDYTGTQRYFGYDGNSYEKSAAIRGDVDGSVSDGEVPGMLNFLTAPAGTLTSRMVIASSGNVGIGTFSAVSLPGELLTVQGNISSSGTITGDAIKGGTTQNTGSFDFPGAIVGYNVQGLNVLHATYNLTLTMAVPDAGLNVCFVAPTSGIVEIEVQIYFDGGTTGGASLIFGLSDAASYNPVQAYYEQDMAQGVRFAHDMIVHKWVVSGLTKGTTYKYWLGAKVTSTSGTPFLAWGGNSTGRFCDFIMKATALPSNTEIET